MAFVLHFCQPRKVREGECTKLFDRPVDLQHLRARDAYFDTVRYKPRAGLPPMPDRTGDRAARERGFRQAFLDEPLRVQTRVAASTAQHVSECLIEWQKQQIWKALDLDPEYVDVQVLLARSESKLRNLQKAMAADSTGPPEVEDELKIRIKKHYIEGVTFYMNGLYEEAISEWEEVLRLDPANEGVKTNIERARTRLEMMGAQG